MTRRGKTRGWMLAAAAALCAAPAAAQELDRRQLREQAAQLFGPLPEQVPPETYELSQPKIDLGRKLYYETRISKSGTIACNTCHQLDAFGVDNEPTSPGHEGTRGDRNSPTVYNAALHVDQFWDGRADTLEEQAKGPILNPVEMGMPASADVLEVLKGIPGYAPLFAEAFPEAEDPFTYDNVATAIGAFERRLMTPGPLDDFIAGDLDAMSEEELRGMQTFVTTGCTTCHNGPAVGGRMYQKLGLVNPYDTEDTGRYKVTGKESDKYVFKVPSLRNIAETGPYFHDGGVGTLPEAVRLMGWHQLGKKLSDAEVASILTFLESLTGRVPTEYVAKPEMP